MPFTKSIIKQQFTQSIDTYTLAEQSLSPLIEQAGITLLQCLLSDHKVLCYGQDDSTFNAQYCASLLVNRLGTDRPSLPVIPLSNPEKQIYAFGNQDDLLIIFSTQSTKNVLSAIEAAHAKGLIVILLTGKDPSHHTQLDAQDIEICTPSSYHTRIHELQLVIIHCLCDIIDTHLFGNGD